MSTPNKDEFYEQHMRLVEAAGRLYFAGVWTLQGDLTQEQQSQMWADLRDALGLKPGAATAAGVASPSQGNAK